MKIRDLKKAKKQKKNTIQAKSTGSFFGNNAADAFVQPADKPSLAGGKSNSIQMKSDPNLVSLAQLKTANQSSELIQKKPKRKKATVNHKMSDKPYGWNAKYHVNAKKKSIDLTIKIKLVPQKGVKKSDLNHIKSQSDNAFARYFDQRFNLVDDAGNKRKVKARLKYVRFGQHLKVKVHPGKNRDNLLNWHVGSDAITRAHELGHQLGLKDEYQDARTESRKTATSSGVFKDNSLMGNYYTEGKDKADLKNRHLNTLAKDIGDAIGTNLTAEKRDTYIVRKEDTLTSIAAMIYGDSSKWTEIQAANKDAIKGAKVKPGQELKLPPKK